MSQVAFAAPKPPPPPPPLAQKCPTAAGKSKLNTGKTQLPQDECRWAVDYPELQKACFLSRVCQYEQPKKCRYYDISSLLQVGPTCGLTALSMLLNGQPSAEELLAVAIEKNYTKNGEMFSAQNLYELTQQHFGSCEFYEGVLNCDYIKQQLIEGCCLFVPYPFLQNKY